MLEFNKIAKLNFSNSDHLNTGGGDSPIPNRLKPTLKNIDTTVVQLDVNPQKKKSKIEPRTAKLKSSTRLS